jgi:hypothetical protein
MAEKKYDPILVKRVAELREGLEPQVLSALWTVDQGLREKVLASRLRRILSAKVFGGDAPYIERMEKAKAKVLKARS